MNIVLALILFSLERNLGPVMKIYERTGSGSRTFFFISEETESSNSVFEKKAARYRWGAHYFDHPMNFFIH